jgi:hypothetical protein
MHGGAHGSGGPVGPRPGRRRVSTGVPSVRVTETHRRGSVVALSPYSALMFADFMIGPHFFISA